MIKKGVSLLMALALCLTLLPASTLAAEAQGQAGQEQTVLTQGNDGQTQAPGQDGAGEDDKTSDEAPEKHLTKRLTRSLTRRFRLCRR